jgi:hypothetical protein
MLGWAYTQGSRPGLRYAALSGLLKCGVGLHPGLTPWANICRPFRALEMLGWAYTQGSRPGLTSIAPLGLDMMYLPLSSCLLSYCGLSAHLGCIQS